MKRALLAAIIVGALPLITSGCVVPEGPYGYHGSPGYDLGYYQSSGVHYGGWGAGYDVGPVHGGNNYHAPPPPRHSWRPPPAHTPVPSPSWSGRSHGGR